MVLTASKESSSRCTSIVRPASAATSRASAICSLVRAWLGVDEPAAGKRPAAAAEPSSVMKLGGFWPLSAPKSVSVSILWTFVIAARRGSLCRG